MKASELFTFSEDNPFAQCFSVESAPWEWVGLIEEALGSVAFPSPSAALPPGLVVEGPVQFEEGVKLPPYGYVRGPAYFGAGTELRPGVYVRGNVICGRRCVLGNSCEYKNCLLLDEVETAHFNYVGDSVLGRGAHLGAGAILSNLRFDRREVCVRLDGRKVPTGLRKLGALLGDGAEVGCNSALQPGTILGKGAVVGPCAPFAGTLEAGRTVVKISR